MHTSIQLALYIQPKASRDSFVGWHGEEFKLAITAPPVDGKANEYVIKLLAKTFKVPKKNIVILNGELSRHKRVKIIAPSVIPEELLEAVSYFNKDKFE